MSEINIEKPPKQSNKIVFKIMHMILFVSIIVLSVIWYDFKLYIILFLLAFMTNVNNRISNG